ncbi:MAG: peptide chain release factor N(5)-glutamine methyltransferase [Gemmatimonadales bacterium]|nr:peptide chain release factor N(5)-glutamine methyltransferase [Gemmatimonadales bacterium]
MSAAPPRLLSSEEEQRLGAEGVRVAREALERLEAGLRTLPDKPEETTISALRALWSLAGGHAVSATLAPGTPLHPLGTAETERFRQLIERRLAGDPLAHLTERQHFMGLEMLAGPGALIPRRETEIVGHAAVRLARRLAEAQGQVLVVDVCTGSGNVAAAVAVSEPRAQVLASDLAEDAVALAERNMAHLGVASRVTLRTGDLLAPFETPEYLGHVDLLTCNPPYISTGRTAEMPTEIAQHEPKLAFDGGPLGIRILQRLIREAPRLLRPGGWLAFEVGLGQGPSVGQRLQRSGDYAEVESLTDEAGNVRVLVARTADRPR